MRRILRSLARQAIEAAISHGAATLAEEGAHALARRLGWSSEPEPDDGAEAQPEAQDDTL